MPYRFWRVAGFRNYGLPVWPHEQYKAYMKDYQIDNCKTKQYRIFFVQQITLNVQFSQDVTEYLYSRSKIIQPKVGTDNQHKMQSCFISKNYIGHIIIYTHYPHPLY